MLLPRIVSLLELTELYPNMVQTLLGEVEESHCVTQAGAQSLISALYTSNVPLPKSPLRSLKRTNENFKC